MITRLAAKSDIHTIILLQEMNLFDNLSRLEREQNGFVTTPFTIHQLKRLIADLGLFVVESDDQVHGCPRFSVGITFINKGNERSYRAHARRLGMTVVDEFQHGGREYYSLAFDTAVSVLQ
ncbi:MAG TPA: hypothetical protein DDY32_08320 [Desulfobulbaceae bacterium]|nr:hypothetical protein [Desulfobulbaceae bacterium]